jgi:hypothetical protein
MEIEMLKDECQIYKEQGEEMKKIVLNDVYKHSQKIMETEMEATQITTGEEGGPEEDELEKKVHHNQYEV